MNDEYISHEVEGQLIGSILRDGKVYPRIRDIVQQDSFHSSICQDIFAAMSVIHSNSLVVDAVTVGDQLERVNKLDTIKHGAHYGRMALSKFREMGNAKHAETYAATVQDYFGKREFVVVAQQVAHWSKNGRRAVDIWADTRNLIDTVYAKVSNGTSNSKSAKEAASLSYDETVNASKGIINFAPTGIADLDKWFRMRKKNLTILAGRPGQGKTAALVTITLNNARHLVRNNLKGKVLFLSMEMSVEEVTARFLSQISRVPAQRVLDGEMTAAEWKEYHSAVEEFENLPVVINDIPALAVNQIRNEARLWLKDDEENLLIVDYLQLATSGEKKINRVDEVGAIARGLKVFAQEKNIPVLAAAQLSRAIEQRADKRPILSDLRESGNIEQDANNVIFLYNDEEDNVAVGQHETESLRKIIVAKQRNGATSYDKGKGDVVVRWVAPIMRFENADIKVERFGNT